MEHVLSDEIDELLEIRERTELDLYRDNFQDNMENNLPIPQADLERELLQLQRGISEQNFESMDQIQEYLNSKINNPKCTKNKLSTKEKAQDLLFDAYEATGKRRLQLAEEALKLNPNSPDAYIILAEAEKNPEERLSLYKAGLEAGEKELGKSFIRDNKGYFWGLTETRPYMRVKYTYAALLQTLGRLQEAVAQYEELLELNPGDNQGVRYGLFTAYVEAGHIQEAEALLKKYNEESNAHGAFNNLLIEYVKNGLTQKTKRLIKRAKALNPFVIDYLTGKKKLPNEEVNSYILGSESEAAVYAVEHIHLWERHVELVEWLAAGSS